MEKIEKDGILTVIKNDDEIEEIMIKIIEKYKGHEIKKGILIKEIRKVLDRQNIIISQRRIKEILEKLERKGLVKKSRFYYEIL